MKPIPKLADDICRCLDGNCPERHDCLRWLEREISHGNRLSMTDSLRVYDQEGDACIMKIKALDEE